MWLCSALAAIAFLGFATAAQTARAQAPGDEWKTMLGDAPADPGPLARLSPSTLFGECVMAILHPSTRTLGPVYVSQLQGAVMGSPLPFWDSLMVAWPQIVGLVAATILLFVGGYVAFQRQEVRA